MFVPKWKKGILELVDAELEDVVAMLELFKDGYHLCRPGGSSGPVSYEHIPKLEPIRVNQVRVKGAYLVLDDGDLSIARHYCYDPDGKNHWVDKEGSPDVVICTNDWAVGPIKMERDK